MIRRFLCCLVIALTPLPLFAADLTPVGDDDWKLRIVIFNVGQADAALVLARNGDAALIDVGRKKADGLKIASYLLDETSGGNGIKKIEKVKFLFATHYDADHIGGVTGLKGNITAGSVIDQGPSK